jgi:hypothetical protein
MNHINDRLQNAALAAIRGAGIPTSRQESRNIIGVVSRIVSRLQTLRFLYRRADTSQIVTLISCPSELPCIYTQIDRSEQRI